MAGESFTATLADVSATGRTCSYAFKAVTPFSVSCTAENGVFVLSVSAAQSLALKAGNVYFAAFAVTTEGGATECVDSGHISVEPNPLAASDYDAAIAAVESAILKYASNANRRIQIGSMSVEYRSQDDLVALLAYYRAEKLHEFSGRPGGPTRFLTRFSW